MDSAIQPGGGHCVPVHGHQPARCGGLGSDAVLLRLPVRAGAGEVAEVWRPPAVLCRRAAHLDRGQAGDFAYQLEFNTNRHRLT